MQSLLICHSRALLNHCLCLFKWKEIKPGQHGKKGEGDAAPQYCKANAGGTRGSQGLKPHFELIVVNMKETKRQEDGESPWFAGGIYPKIHSPYTLPVLAPVRASSNTCLMASISFLCIFSSRPLKQKEALIVSSKVMKCCFCCSSCPEHELPCSQ